MYDLVIDEAKITVPTSSTRREDAEITINREGIEIDKGGLIPWTALVEFLRARPGNPAAPR